MSILKKTAALLLALGMTAGFVACGGNKGGESVENSQESSVESAKQEQIKTEAEWNAVIDAVYAATNFTLKYTRTEGENSQTVTVQCVDGKGYSEVKIQTETSTTMQYTYIGQVEGKCYIWNSTDKTEWQSEEYTGTENPTTAKYFLMRILDLCAFMGSDYNANTGVYTFTYLGGVFVEASLADGKVSNYYYEEAQDKWERGELTYGNATVGELPALN